MGTGVVHFGVFNVGADEPHSDPVYALLSTARGRSIAVRSRDIKVPDLGSVRKVLSQAPHSAGQ